MGWDNLPPHLMKKIRSDSVTPASALSGCDPALKYGNKITEVDGIAFDSTKEADYYSNLKWLQRVSTRTEFFLKRPIRTA